MSFLLVGLKPRARSLISPLLAALLLALPDAAPAGAPGSPGTIPDVQVRSLATSEDVRLATELAGRPAVVLLTDGSGPPACAVGRAAAALQEEYGPWFSWVAVLSGPFAPADLERVRNSSAVRLERLFLDRAGALRAVLAIEKLPTLLLLDERGRIRETCSPDGSPAGLERVAGTLAELAASSRRSTAGVEHFRLPLVGSDSLVSFLDVAGRDGTMVAFLQSRCLACAHELEVLDFARDRSAGAVSFVAVFLDPAPDSRIRGFLAAAGASPDFVLRDPEFRLAGKYGISAAPALLVIDRGGRVVASRSGYREGERDALYQDLLGAFRVAAATTAREADAVAEARRLHGEACALLREGKAVFALSYQERIAEILPGYPSVQLRIAEAALAAGEREVALQSLRRYLADEPETYDSAAVRQTIAGLLVAPR